MIGQEDATIELYKQASTTFTIIQKKEGVALCLNNTGYVYNRLARYSKALEYYQQALEIDKKTGNNIGLTDSNGCSK